MISQDIAAPVTPPTPQQVTVETFGWDTAFVVPIADVNAAIVSASSSPPSFLQSGSEFVVGGTFGPWQVTTGGSGKQVRLGLPLTGVDLRYPSTGHEEHFTSGVAVIEVELEYLPHDGDGQGGGSRHDLKVRATAADPADPPVSLISLDLIPTAGTVAEAVIGEALTEWATANLVLFAHTFAVVDLNPKVASGDFSFVSPNYTSYAYLDGPAAGGGVLGVLCMTGDRVGDHLSEQIDVNAIPAGARCGFLISQERTLVDLVRPALIGAYGGLSPDSVLVDPAGDTLYLADGVSVPLTTVSHDGTVYTPYLTQLQVTSNGEIVTLQSFTTTEIAAGITATCQSTHWYTIKLGSSSNGQTLQFVEVQPAVIVHNIVRSEASTIATVIIEIAAAIALVILGILTDGAAFIVGGLVIGLIAGAAAIVPPLIEKINADDSPSLDLLTVNAVDPIAWTGGAAFTLTSALMNASLQLGGHS